MTSRINGNFQDTEAALTRALYLQETGHPKTAEKLGEVLDRRDDLEATDFSSTAQKAYEAAAKKYHSSEDRVAIQDGAKDLAKRVAHVGMGAVQGAVEGSSAGAVSPIPGGCSAGLIGGAILGAAKGEMDYKEGKAEKQAEQDVLVERQEEKAKKLLAELADEA